MNLCSPHRRNLKTIYRGWEIKPWWITYLWSSIPSILQQWQYLHRYATDIVWKLLFWGIWTLHALQWALCGKIIWLCCMTCRLSQGVSAEGWMPGCWQGMQGVSGLSPSLVAGQSHPDGLQCCSQIVTPPYLCRCWFKESIIWMLSCPLSIPNIQMLVLTSMLFMP